MAGRGKNTGKGDENGNLGARLMRYGRVSTTVAGLASRLAGERFLGIKIDRSEHAVQLMQALGSLKGPLMKIGQILSTIPEALPPEYARAFQELQSNAPPMGWLFVKRRMKSELGPAWESNFSSFSKEAAAAASLGQVHFAQDKNGKKLACKLQYPDMESAIMADLSQLNLIFSIFERYDKAIQTRNIQAELSARLREELDYNLEARHTRLYQFMLKEERHAVQVPEIIQELSTKRLLTSTWLEGSKILDFVSAPREIRNRLALNMFRAWYVPFYYYGVIHGDPHLGNYTVREDHAINLLDFGCVRIFPPRFVGGVIELYKALETKDIARSVHAYGTWGFKGLTREQIDTLNIWANFLYAPVLEDKIRPIGEVSGGVYGRETAEKVHKKLRELSRHSGGIAIPREFVFMDRAALGLGSVFLHLRAEINWYRVFNELIEGFDVQALQKRQRDSLKKFALKVPD